MSQHPGIKIRVRTPAGIVLEGDSDFLHYAASWGHGVPVGEWSCVLRHQEDLTEIIAIDIQPVMLDDAPAVPDDASALEPG